MVTNVPLSAVHQSGTRDTITHKIVPKYARVIRNIAVWGADEVVDFLNRYPGIRTSFLHFIVPGDVISQLMSSHLGKSDEIAKTLQSYLHTTFGREQNAQLDQAGDVSDDPVQLQEVFFDLAAEFDEDFGRWSRSDLHKISALTSPSPHGRSVDVVRLMLAEIVDRVVVVGGPGEGKSTVGQYLAQLHRATLLTRVDKIALSPQYYPEFPRIPIRVILKDYGQWLATASSSEPSSASLDKYICEQIEAATSRPIDTLSLHKLISDNPTLLILDGLDEVTDTSLKKLLVERLAEFTERCKEALKANLQILATTRPTGYTEQFDPRKYLHLSLLKLEPKQVREYIGRWTRAKKFDHAKSTRVLESFEECLTDQQAALLTTTPLQVTILALIIASGGTPPRQREALFNKYLEVIYERET